MCIPEMSRSSTGTSALISMYFFPLTTHILAFHGKALFVVQRVFCLLFFSSKKDVLATEILEQA